MATQAAKMMLFQNGKSFPAQLLRGSLRAGAINTITKSNTESLINSQYFLGRQSAAAGLDIGDLTDVSILNRQFGVFGNAGMGRVETRGKKTVADDSDEDSDDSDDGDEVYDDAEDSDGDTSGDEKDDDKED